MFEPGHEIPVTPEASIEKYRVLFSERLKADPNTDPNLDVYIAYHHPDAHGGEPNWTWAMTAEKQVCEAGLALALAPQRLAETPDQGDTPAARAVKEYLLAEVMAKTGINADPAVAERHLASLRQLLRPATLAEAELSIAQPLKTNPDHGQAYLESDRASELTLLRHMGNVSPEQRRQFFEGLGAPLAAMLYPDVQKTDPSASFYESAANRQLMGLIEKAPTSQPDKTPRAAMLKSVMSRHLPQFSKTTPSLQ